MIKKILGLLLGVMIFYGVMPAINVFAANPKIVINSYDFENFLIEVKYGDVDNEPVYLDGKSFVIFMINGDIIPDSEALIKDGRTLVPLRVISEKLGADIQWNSDERSIDIWQDENYIKMYIDDNNMYFNNEMIYTDVSPQIINSITYVPLRTIGEAFSADVGYYSGFDNDSPYIFPVVWVSNRTGEIKMSEDEAVKIAENLFFDFLQHYYEDNTITLNNFSEKMQVHTGYDLKYNIRCVSDFGEYYYVMYSDDLPRLGILIDKYDGSYFAVGAHYECLLNINNDLKTLGTAMPY